MLYAQTLPSKHNGGPCWAIASLIVAGRPLCKLAKCSPCPCLAKEGSASASQQTLPADACRTVNHLAWQKNGASCRVCPEAARCLGCRAGGAAAAAGEAPIQTAPPQAGSASCAAGEGLLDALHAAYAKAKTSPTCACIHQGSPICVLTRGRYGPICCTPGAVHLCRV